MTTLFVGFDSAWTPMNAGALVGATWAAGGRWEGVGLPVLADFPTATRQILEWQEAVAPDRTVVLLDQPTIVRNELGQRPVENLIASPVSRRYGGVQPANTGRAEMFGRDAPVWAFLDRFGGAASPDALARSSPASTLVFETYPVLALIAMGWVLPDRRSAGRLPKYNPARRKTFRLSDWRFVCQRAADAFGARGLAALADELRRLGDIGKPRKQDQDALDACLCLLVGFHLVPPYEGLVVGDEETGFLVTPASDSLEEELVQRCVQTDRDPSRWLRRLRHGSAT